MDEIITLHGRIFILAHIQTLTGLIIGGNDTGLEIGGVDKVLIRNPLTKQPYIPGSSLRGKMRSQLEKKLGLPQNHPIGQNVKIHSIHKDGDDYTEVCHIFGVAGEFAQHPTLLTVRDVPLTPESADALSRIKSSLQYTEIKTEVAIDRVTSQATPRTLERVPAGATFGPAELVFSIYARTDYARLKYVIDAMQLVEDDYLGGAGSRGSGKVKFTSIKVTARARSQYTQEATFRMFDNVQELAKASSDLKSWAETTVPIG